MKPKHQRLLFYICSLAAASAALWLVLTTLEENIVYFHSPTDIAQKPPATSEYIRVGGLVREGSVKKDGVYTTFVVTDYEHTIVIKYDKILPALFREGQGIVAEGHYNSGIFTAKTILAKHDENYMPPEVAKSLETSGHPAKSPVLDENAVP